MSSSGFLALLALCGFVLLTRTVHTSDIVKTPELAINHTPGEQQNNSNTPSGGANHHAETLNGVDQRKRSGRMYQQASNHHSAPLESYAAAYAAANSPSSGSDQSASAYLTQQATNDPSAYASFGEAPPSSSAGSERAAASLVSGSSARQLPSASDYAPSSGYFANFMSPSTNEISYSGQPGSNYHSPSLVQQQQQQQHQQQQHHYYKSPAAASSLPLGYPSNAYERNHPMSSYYDRMAHHHMPAASTPLWATTSNFNSASGGGLMSSASNAISHWTNGFSIAEIICGLVALAIGAVILGAPFFLIYLALMGNFSGSGTLSLTNPISSTAAAGGASAPANGRRKRLAVFEAMNVTSEQARKHPDFALVAESVVKQLSPFVDLQQVSRTFKQLIGSIEKYSPKHTERNDDISAKREST